MERLRGAALVLSVVAAGCALTTDFSGYDPIPAGTRPTHVVGGTISGIASAATITLSLNGVTAPFGDGPFTFADPRVPQGDAYEVTVVGSPADLHCSVARGKATMGTADVTDVAVTCLSDDAALTELALQGTSIFQSAKPQLGFTPLVTAYKGWILANQIAKAAGNDPSTAKLTARARRADATITVGADSAPSLLETTIALPTNVATTSVDVTASSGAKQSYTIELTRAYAAPFAGNVSGGIAIAGDLVAVGNWLDTSASTGINGSKADGGLSGAGAVTLYRRNPKGAWLEEAYVKPAFTAKLMEFGTSVALSDDLLVVGAPGEGSAASGVDGNATFDCDKSTNCQFWSGAAYVFERVNGTWTQTAYVKATNEFLGRLGAAVAVSRKGEWIALGQPGASYGYGAVVVLKKSAGKWVVASTLTLPGGASNDAFGHSVAVTNDTLVAGAPSDFNHTIKAQTVGSAGKAGVYKLTNGAFTYDTTLVASVPRAGSVFGSAVAADGATIVVGAEGEFSSATGIGGNPAATGAATSGAAYVFVKQGNAWTNQAYVKASNARTYGCFGSAVALDGDVMLVGSPGESSGKANDPSDTSTPGAGATYVFRRNGSSWSEVGYVKSLPAITILAEFGTQVALAAGVGAITSSFTAGVYY
jgi:hypothetical protein